MIQLKIWCTVRVFTGKPLHAYAGKEISRALAKGSLKTEDIGSDTLHDLSQAEMERLEAEEKVYASKYDCVGQVSPELKA